MIWSPWGTGSTFDAHWWEYAGVSWELADCRVSMSWADSDFTWEWRSR